MDLSALPRSRSSVKKWVCHDAAVTSCCTDNISVQGVEDDDVPTQLTSTLPENIHSAPEN